MLSSLSAPLGVGTMIGSQGASLCSAVPKSGAWVAEVAPATGSEVILDLGEMGSISERWKRPCDDCTKRVGGGWGNWAEGAEGGSLEGAGVLASGGEEEEEEEAADRVERGSDDDEGSDEVVESCRGVAGVRSRRAAAANRSSNLAPRRITAPSRSSAASAAAFAAAKLGSQLFFPAACAAALDGICTTCTQPSTGAARVCLASA